MDQRTQERVRRLNYDHHRRMVELHQQWIDRGELAHIEKVDDLSYRTLLQAIPKNRMAILELGSSEGKQFPLLAEWLAPGGVLHGIDLYEPNVRAAQASGLHIELGFVEDMRVYPAASFDLVCSRHVLEHLGDIDDGISEIMRVTRPGGFVANVTPDLQADNEPAHLNRLDLQKWTDVWLSAGLRLKSARRHPFHGGEVHVVGYVI